VYAQPINAIAVSGATLVVRDNEHIVIGAMSTVEQKSNATFAAPSHEPDRVGKVRPLSKRGERARVDNKIRCASLFDSSDIVACC